MLAQSKIKDIISSYNNFPMAECVKESICTEILNFIIEEGPDPECTELYIELVFDQEEKILAVRLNGDEVLI